MDRHNRIKGDSSNEKNNHTIACLNISNGDIFRLPKIYYIVENTEVSKNDLNKETFRYVKEGNNELS